MLNVQGNLGLGRSQEQAEHATWDSYDEVFYHLSMKGFDPAGKPPFPIPDIIPEQYTNLEGDQYSILMGRVDKWFSYASGTLAEIRGRLIAIRNEMDMIGVDLRRVVRTQVEQSSRKKPTDTEMKDMVKEQPRYRELLKYEQDYEIAQKQVEAVLESLERHAKGLSRQVTIRGQEIDLGVSAIGRKPPRRISE